jgi:hypothetical protein
MKAYPVTKSELWQLFAIGFLASLSFSIGMGLLTFGVEIYKDLSINPPASTTVLNYWNGIRDRCLDFSCFFFFVGVIFMFFGGAKIFEIFGQTEFNED